VDLDVADVDLALRYGPVASMPPTAVRMFGEQLTPVASPWLLKSGPPCASRPTWRTSP
jgi:LysR family glycine cleavage system transcriptional activator